MEEAPVGWWRKHALTITLLLSAVAIAIFVRTAWMYPLIQQFGAPNLFGGGSDSFYHFRVSYYIVLNHRNLIFDPLLNYPNGAINPREPLFDWMNAILGILFAGFFGGNTQASTSWFLEAAGPIWAALGIFPVYLIGKEITNKRVGILSGFLYAVSVGNIDSSTFGYANYLAFYTFFILLTIYAYLRTIRAAGTRRWVTRYSSPREIVRGLRAFVRTERTAVRWAVFTGVCFGALALAWQGFSFFVAAVVIFMIFALLVERIRRVDSFGLYAATWLVGLVGFPMALPYYYVQGLALNWFGLPLLVFAGGLLIALPLVLLRDQPWILSIPAFLGVGALGIGAIDVINHAQFENIVTGQGYFVKTLIYSTVAEAQAPSIDALILGYGVLTFFVAFFGLGLWVWRAIRGRFPRVLMFGIVFAVISIYLPISAAKFFFLGSAAFAILPSEAIIRALDIAGLPKLRRTIGQLSDRGSQLTAFRRAFKVRNAVVLLAITGLLLPNVWYAIDAGIPYNTKGTFDTQVYDTLPPFLQTTPGNASSFYLGADGTELDTPPQYDEAGYNWLAQQDVNLPEAKRPAFVSWWDYGFQAIAQGDHPSVADNFQNGIDPSGNFLLAQNESLGIAVLTTALLVAEQKASGDPGLPTGLQTVLRENGVDMTSLHLLLTDEQYDRQLVLADPNRYLAVDPNNLDGENSLYDTVSWELADTRSLEGMSQLYDAVQQYTGWTIRYAMVDDRLFPFSGQSTGIFYAPADLTDRVISSGGIPTTYFNVSITGSDGNTYPYGALPAGVSPTAYPITYYSPFYNSMLYHIFAGYNGTEVGEGSGIPGISGGVSDSNPEPGWMMQHFEVVYETAYYCPYSDIAAHPGCAQAMNLPVANQLAKANNGSVETGMDVYASEGGEMILAYYPGQTVTGTIALADGTPVAGARVTVYDSFHIPHMTAVTGSNGVYSLVLPPGNDTLNVTTGTFDALSQADTTVLASINESVAPQYGYSFDAPTLVRSITLAPATVDGVVYINAASNSTYIPNTDPLAVGATVNLVGASGVYHATADASGTYTLDHVAPGEYNMTVDYQGVNSTNSSLGPVYANAGKITNRSFGIGPGSVSGQVLYPNGTFATGAVVTVTGPSGVESTATVDSGGNYTISNVPAGNVTLTAETTNGAYRIAPIALNLSGATLSENLSLTQFGTVSLTVLSGGSPIAGFPVRFTPIVPYPTSAPKPTSSSSTAPPNGTGATTPPGPTGTPAAHLDPAQTNATNTTTNRTAPPVPTPASVNSTVLTTSPDGTITAELPVGNYSIYGYGLAGGTWSAGIANAEVGSGIQSLPPLSVTPAHRLYGTIQAPNAGANGSAATVQVLAYDAAGDVTWTFINNTGNWGLELPRGSYSILAVDYPSSSSPDAFAQVGAINLTGASAALPLSLQPAVAFQPYVATNGRTAGSQVPVVGARVNLTVPNLDLSLGESVNASGNVTYLLPASLPEGATICLSASAPGYVSTSACQLTPLDLTSRKLVGLSAENLTASVHVTGLPGGATATLNFTSVAGAAPNVVVHSGSSTTVTLTPGDYQVTGWTSAGSTPTLYETVEAVNVTVPVGGPAPSVTVPLLAVVGCTGELTLAPGLDPTNVSVQLYGNGVSETVTGAAFLGTERLPAGTYTVLATGGGDNASYSYFGHISFNSTGVQTPAIPLTIPGVSVTFNLTLGGSTLANATVSALLESKGLSVPIQVVGGRYVTILPAGTPVNLSVHSLEPLPTANGVVLYRLTVASSAPPCVPFPPEALCPVPLEGDALLSGASGLLSIPGFPGGVPGQVTFYGPGTSTAAQTVTTASNGSFTADLAPGTYTVYADAVEGSSVYANLSILTVPATPVAGVSLPLSEAWTATITVGSPPGGATVLGTTLTVRAQDGLSLVLPNVTLGAPLSVVLPTGVYTMTASVSGSPYGVPANATGTATLALYLGNGATSIPLAWTWERTVDFSTPGHSYDLGNGGTARIPFSVRNTGNRPFRVGFVGSPSTYNITFSPANASLGLAPTNDSVSGTATVIVPTGAAVAHPPIQLEAVVLGGTGGSAGFASPAPTINLTPDFVLRGGAAASSDEDTGPRNASVPFYLYNPGNAIEYVSLNISDAVRLAGIGWVANFTSGGNRITAPVTLDPGSNTTYSVNLVAVANGALPPGSVTVIATVLNDSSTVRTILTLSVPTAKVAVTSGSLSVSGPGVGSAPSYPDWLVPVLSFVPAAAFVGVVLVYRWYRTRRWTRR